MTTTAIKRAAKSGASTEAMPQPQLLFLDPRTLLIDKNVRIGARPDAGMIASIAEHSILQPVVAVRTKEGQYRVLFGHSRTLGAIQAEQDTVPVYVAADEATDDAGQIERVLKQWDENEHRAGLTVADKVNAVWQLTAFGLPADQIAPRLRTASQPEVDAALAAAGSERARAATIEHDFLDLTHLAVIAEFQEDAEAVEQLIEAAEGGKNLDHLAERLRRTRDEAAREAACVARLREAGITLVDPDSDEVSELDDLVTAEGEELDAANHAQCPGHAAYVVSDSGYVDAATGEPAEEEEDENAARSLRWGQFCRAEYVCTDPATHGHLYGWEWTARSSAQDTSTPEGKSEPQVSEAEPQISEAERQAAIVAEQTAQREAARLARRELIANNKDWASAESVRRRTLREKFVTRKSAPKGTASFIATAIAVDGDLIGSSAGHVLACQWLGCEKGYGRSSALAALITKAVEARAQVLVLAQVLAAYEAKINRDHWQKQYHQDYVVRYLRFLEANGYPLSRVELLACGQTPQPAATQEPGDTGESSD